MGMPRHRAEAMAKDLKSVGAQMMPLAPHQA
jgi:hypothetical protein